MEMLYLINKKDIDYLLNFEVTRQMIDMMGNEGIRSYEFKLHKSALKEQLACFLKEEKDRRRSNQSFLFFSDDLGKILSFILGKDY